MKFSVKLLLFVMAFCAVTVSALVGANEKSLRMIATVTLILNLGVVTTALVGSGTRRVFAIGFLVGCLPYLYMAYGNHGTGRRYLATEVALVVLDTDWKISEPRKTPTGETVYILRAGQACMLRPVGVYNGQRRVISWEEAESKGYLKYAYTNDQFPSRESFLSIGHFAFGLLFGVAAGAWGVYVSKSRQ